MDDVQEQQPPQQQEEAQTNNDNVINTNANRRRRRRRNSGNSDDSFDGPRQGRARAASPPRPVYDNGLLTEEIENVCIMSCTL